MTPFLAITIFFVSGVSGLIYEVLWFKHLAVIWGNSTLATGAVTAAFMLGLSIGAWGVGLLGHRVRNELRVYGMLELLVASLALLVPFEFEAMRFLAGIGYDAISGSPVMYTIARFALTFVILGPPCAMMGGTLPLMIGWLTRLRRTTADHATGILYGINTLGAGIGVLLAGFVLLPHLGLSTTNAVAISLNVGAGMAALLLGKTYAHVSHRSSFELPDRVASGQLSEASGSAQGIRSMWTVSVAAFLAGFASLSMETVWIRQLVLALGASTYAFSAILFMILFGIAIGSLCYSWFLSKRVAAGDAHKLLTYVVVVIVTAAYVGQLSLPTLAQSIGALSSLRESDIGNAVICLGTSMVLALLPAVGMGLLLPIITSIVNTGYQSAGRHLGQIYSANTLGCILGATISSAAIIPARGTWYALVASVVAYLNVVLLLERFEVRLHAVVRLCLICCAMALFVRSTSPVPIVPLNMGQYLYGESSPRDVAEVLAFKEGASSNVLVTRLNSQISLRVNGKVDASTGASDMQTQLALAYFPRILKPQGKEILVIGYGSGTTAGASLLFPGTHVTCCELEPAVLELAAHFSMVNHRPYDSPNFVAINDDARSYLQGTKKLFDVIISEPSNPWMDGVAALYTVEHFRASQRRLRKGGLYVQWIQTYTLEPSDYALIIRTLSSVYKYCALLLVHDGDTILIACDEPLQLSSELLERSQAECDSLPEVRQDLKKYFGTGSIRSLLLGRYVLSGSELNEMGELSTAVNSDQNMRLAFDAPRRLFSATGNPVFAVLMSKLRASRIVERFQEWGCDVRQVSELRNLGQKFVALSDHQQALQITEFAISIDETNPSLQVDRQLLLVQSGKGLDRSVVTRIAQSSPLELNRLGVGLWKMRRYDLAILVFEEVIRAAPNSSMAWENLSINYRATGQADKALTALRRASELDPCRRIESSRVE